MQSNYIDARTGLPDLLLIRPETKEAAKERVKLLKTMHKKIISAGIVAPMVHTQERTYPRPTLTGHTPLPAEVVVESTIMGERSNKEIDYVAAIPFVIVLGYTVFTPLRISRYYMDRTIRSPAQPTDECPVMYHITVPSIFNKIAYPRQTLDWAKVVSVGITALAPNTKLKLTYSALEQALGERGLVLPHKVSYPRGSPSQVASSIFYGDSFGIPKLDLLPGFLGELYSRQRDV